MSGDQALCPTCGQAYPIRVAHCMTDGTRLVVQRAQAGGMEGRVLGGKYQIGALIGEGVLGATYLGKQVIIEREVAIKLVRPAYASDRASADRFFAAARIACGLAGPSIVTSLDFGMTEGVMYAVSELARGRSIDHEIAGQPMPVRRVVPMAIQICDALAAAHASGVSHGDLKPSNILVIDEAARRDVIKITDFGLVRAVELDLTALDPARLRYLAPELATGSPVDPLTDLYALGCILHEALTGKPPFHDATTRGMMDRHAREIAPRLPRDVPPNLVKIVTRLMAKGREQRFESAIAVRHELHAVLGTTPATSAFVVGDGGAPRRGPITEPHAQRPITSPDRTINEQAPAVMAQTGVRPAPGYGTQPDRTALVTPAMTASTPDSASSSGVPRIVVILIVAVLVSGVGILAYVFAT
ncbi:MAG: protein kinase [Proteobacteria bacterium]|nr:protein kinase [Pseudomonadota bacterium]